MFEKPICAALVGIGWAGAMHANALHHLHGIHVNLKTVCALEPEVCDFAAKYGFHTYTNSYREVLDDPESDVVDLATPPGAHKDMIIQAVKAGKHVICEKPLGGYFGEPGDPENAGDVSKEKMLRKVREDMAEIADAVNSSGKLFCYAENWIYAPAFRRACELIRHKGTTVVQIDSFLCHKGSPAAYVKEWRKSGGGTLSRNLTHPLSAALYLKKTEMETKGLPFGVKSILCDCAQITHGIETRYIQAYPVDTEDWSHAVVTFNDGTKATLTTADTFVGESVNRFDIYGNDSIMKCNFAPNDLLDVYFADDKGIENDFITEKDDHKLGWKHAALCEELIRGYSGELQDFMECVATGRQPLAGLPIAMQVLDLIQLAYCSAEQGRRIEVSDYPL